MQVGKNKTSGLNSGRQELLENGLADKMRRRHTTASRLSPEQREKLIRMHSESPNRKDWGIASNSPEYDLYGDNLPEGY